jgi:putative radical SAM enzyme (TIGR03279 family)
MRETLYFKDDDSRLSFLQGNYVTLTNMSDHDVDRICKYHLSPINVSFHTTNPELRCRMLNNRFAGEALQKVKRLKDAGITMNGQIVLCKGLNDGRELERSISDLSKLMPELQSVSVVPVGLTRYRDGLYPLEPFGAEDAREVLAIIHKWQDRIKEETGSYFVHASDEWYLTAGLPLPDEERYEGYVQLENGVGMVRLMLNEYEDAISHLHFIKKPHEELSIVTGKLMSPIISDMASRLMDRYPGLNIHVYEIINHFFGEMITVSGLLTGQDMCEQLRDKPLGRRVLIPENTLRAGEDYFLDDMTRTQMAETLQSDVQIVKSSGYDFVDKITSSGIRLGMRSKI